MVLGHELRLDELRRWRWYLAMRLLNGESERAVRALCVLLLMLLVLM